MKKGALGKIPVLCANMHVFTQPGHLTDISRKKHLTPRSSNLVSNQMLMGMGSPDNRRKADGSYQTQGVGRGLFAPSSA